MPVPIQSVLNKTQILVVKKIKKIPFRVIGSEIVYCITVLLQNVDMSLLN